MAQFRKVVNKDPYFDILARKDSDTAKTTFGDLEFKHSATNINTVIEKVDDEAFLSGMSITTMEKIVKFLKDMGVSFDSVGAIIRGGDDCHIVNFHGSTCLLYTSPSPRDRQKSRMPSSA